MSDKKQAFNLGEKRRGFFLQETEESGDKKLKISDNQEKKIEIQERISMERCGRLLEMARKIAENPEK